MRKLSKVLLIIVALLMILLITGFFIIFFWLDLNDYKDNIAAIITKNLGHQVQLEGKIEANYFPFLGLTAHNIKVISSSSLQEKPLAVIKKLSFKVQTLPMLRKEFKIDKILVDNASLYLIRDSKGKTNWQIPKNAQNNTSENEPLPPISATTDGSIPAAKKTQTLEISGVDISNSEIFYEDQKSEQIFHVQELDLKSAILKTDQRSPIEGHFSLVMNRGQNQISSVTDFSAELAFNRNDFSLTDMNVRMQVKGDKVPKKQLALNLSGIIEGNHAESKVDFKNLLLKIEDSSITGFATMYLKEEPLLEFTAQVDRWNLDPYLTNTSQSDTLQSVAFKENSNNSIRHVAYDAKKFRYKGTVALGELKVKDLTFTQIDFTIHNQDNAILFDTVKAHLYQGIFQGQSAWERTNKTLRLKGQFSNIQVESLLEALRQKPKITGSAQGNIDLQWGPQGLSGPLRLQINQGVIEGVDLEYYLETARAMLKKEPRPKNDRKRTSFNVLKGTFLANHNYLTNNDLRLDADNLYALGDGSIDLNQKTLEYKFVVHKIYHDGKQHPNALPLAVRIKGPFNDIKIVPDIDAYLKNVVKKEAQEELEEQLNKHLDKILRKEKSSETNTEPAPSEEGSQSESIEDKIEEEIDKGLKKLFKF